MIRNEQQFAIQESLQDRKKNEPIFPRKKKKPHPISHFSIFNFFFKKKVYRRLLPRLTIKHQLTTLFKNSRCPLSDENSCLVHGGWDKRSREQVHVETIFYTVDWRLWSRHLHRDGKWIRFPTSS